MYNRAQQTVTLSKGAEKKEEQSCDVNWTGGSLSSPGMDPEHLAEADKRVEQRSLKVVVGEGQGHSILARAKAGLEREQASRSAGASISRLSPELAHTAGETFPVDPMCRNNSFVNHRI